VPYGKDGSPTAGYMSVKSDSRSLYPYAFGAGAPRMLACDGDEYSWRSNVDNEYAYVDELLPPPPPPASSHQSPPHEGSWTAANNNNACGARQSAPDHVTGCLRACRQYDTAPQDMPRVDVGSNRDIRR